MTWPTADDVKMDQFNMLELPGQQLASANASSPLDHLMKLDVTAPSGCIRMSCIIANLGKSTNNVDTLEKMIAAGMNIAIIHMSFTTRPEAIETIKMIRQVAKSYSTKMNACVPVAIGFQLSGRKIRTGKVAEMYGEALELKTGEFVKLTTDETYKERCSTSTIYIDYIHFSNQMKKKYTALIDNESIELIVEVISSTTLTCRIVKGGMLRSYRDVYIPNVVFDMPNYSDKDKQDVELACKHGVDVLVAPLIQSAKAVTELKGMLGDKAKKMTVISVIQSMEGYKHFDDILQVTDAVLVNRQELGSDLNTKKLIIAQKNLVARANIVNKPIIISAGILNSMLTRCVPYRSEILDIANCILDGADGVMVVAETAIGPHPVEVIKVLNSTFKEAEACTWTKQHFYDYIEHASLPCDQLLGTAMSAVLTAQKCIAALIIVVTTTGHSAQVVAKFRPRCPVIAVTRYAPVARQLHLYRGVLPLLYESSPDAYWFVDVEKRVSFCLKWAMDQGFLRVGDPVVIVSGWRQGSGFTNTMRVIYAANESISFD